MKKRSLSAIVALCLCLTLIPTPALAYVGGIDRGPLFMSAVETETGSVSYGGSEFRSLTTNEGKLVFYLAMDGPYMGRSVTMSERGFVDPAAAIERGVYEQSRFTIQTKAKTQRELKVAKMEAVDVDEAELGVPVPPGSLTVRYTFSGYNYLDPLVLCYINYSIAELGVGNPDGEITAEMEDPDGRTYAVVARAVWRTGDDNVSKYVFRCFQDYHGFSRMGHANADPAAHVKISRTYRSSLLDSAISTDITTGMGRTYLNRSHGNGDVSEIYSDSYGVDSPFVLADVDRIRKINDSWTPVYMTYDAVEDCLIAEGYTDMLGGMAGREGINAIHVWGLRDIYTKEEAKDLSQVKFTDPDLVTIPQDADKLGFYASGESLVVAPITDTARENILKKQYGDPLYTLRGNFEEKRSDNEGVYYEFTDGTAALTSTITATWNNGSEHFRVRVDKDGVFSGFDTTVGVSYTTPRFKLYLPADGVTSPAELGFVTETEDGESETCLTLHMEPADNDVLVFIDIPEVSSKIDTAHIKPDGDLILSGQMGLDLILNCSSDRLATLEALGYGPKENADGTISFEQNGIKAEGSLDTGSLLGLDLAEIEAAINTFEGKEQYDFSLEVNAFEMFEADAKLSLKRLYNGRLVPNDLDVALAAEPGIPLVPPVPTAFLRGGGGGFYGLADTINGDYIAIPPMRLKISAIGDYVKVLKGRLNITVGPSYLGYSGDDIKIIKADVLKSFNMYLKLVGEKRKYLGTTYTGLRAGGGMGITIQAPKGDDAAIFEVDGNVDASMFGGLDNYKNPKSAYIQLDSRGSIGAEIKIPNQIGKLKFKALGGYKLADTVVDFILGAQTAIKVDPKEYEGKDAGEALKIAAASAWDDLSVYGGVSNKGTLLLINYRIYYVIPDKFGGAIDLFWNDMNDWNLEDEIDENAWYVGGKNSAQALSADDSWLTEVGKCYDAESGEQIGIAVMETSMYEVQESGGSADTAELAAQNDDGTYSETITYSAADNASISGCELGIVLIPKGDASAEKLRKDLTVSENGSQLTLKDAAIKNGALDPDANITEIELEDGRSALLVAPGSMSDNDHTWTVTASCDFEHKFIASAQPAELTLNVTDGADSAKASSSVTNGRSGKEYAVRYYLDTDSDRSGEHYFLDMAEDDPYNIDIPKNGSLAPTGKYYVTAVLVEKVTGDFDGDGTDECSWVSVDKKTSADTITYTNDTTPNAPASVELEATGNETLTASWDKVDGADGYRVNLYYQNGSDWKQAGGSYVLYNADFAAGSSIAAASETENGYSLRMAPTVSGKDENGDSDEAPAGVLYKATVEAFKSQNSETYDVTKQHKDGTTSTVTKKLDPYGVYYSNAAGSNEADLPAYSIPEITVIYGNDKSITLNETNGYDTLVWGTLPLSGDSLFDVTGSIENITVESESGAGKFTVLGGGGRFTVTADDDDALETITNSGRVKLTVAEGKDITTYYLRLALDDIAPVLTLDSDNIAADPETGKYTLSGTTEPGLEVTIKGEDDSVIGTAKADSKGHFIFNEALPQDMIDVFDENGNVSSSVPNGFKTLLADITSKDKSGNESIPASAVITAKADDPDTPDKPDDPDQPGTSSGGGSSSSSYAISVDKTEHGSASASHSSAKHGATVTVTVTPDNGYALETLTVIDKNGKEIELKDIGGGKYTFTMPSGSVTVRAAFMEDNSVLNFFYDVPNGAYYYEAVKWAVGKGITTGVGNNLFAPDRSCTRAQIVTFLWRAAGSPEPKSIAAGMSDVVTGSYYEKAVAWAIENGITTGTGDGRFSPDETCTRAQAVTFIARALNAKASGNAAGFSDVPSDSYFADAVAWAAENGVTNGVGNGLFAPHDECTRAQIVTFLWRAYNK